MTNANNASTEDAPAIDCQPGRCGGEPCLAGTRIPMSHVEALLRRGFSMRWIHGQYPHVPLRQLWRAVAQWMNQASWRR